MKFFKKILYLIEDHENFYLLKKVFFTKIDHKFKEF